MCLIYSNPDGFILSLPIFPLEADIGKADGGGADLRHWAAPWSHHRQNLTPETPTHSLVGGCNPGNLGLSKKEEPGGTNH